MINILEDGVNYINVYSQGQTELGRLLSNFAQTPFTFEGKLFQSVESWWYWIKMKNINKDSLFSIFSNQQIDEVKNKIGYNAKVYFRSLYKQDLVTHNPSEFELEQVYLIKLNSHSKIKKMLLENKLPFKHYYVFSGKAIEANDYLWTVELWNKIKTNIKNATENI